MMEHPFISLFMVWSVSAVIPRSIVAWRTGRISDVDDEIDEYDVLERNIRKKKEERRCQK